MLHVYAVVHFICVLCGIKESPYRFLGDTCSTLCSNDLFSGCSGFSKCSSWRDVSGMRHFARGRCSLFLSRWWCRARGDIFAVGTSDTLWAFTHVTIGYITTCSVTMTRAAVTLSHGNVAELALVSWCTRAIAFKTCAAIKTHHLSIAQVIYTNVAWITMRADTLAFQTCSVISTGDIFTFVDFALVASKISWTSTFSTSVTGAAILTNSGDVADMVLAILPRVLFVTFTGVAVDVIHARGSSMTRLGCTVIHINLTVIPL